MTIERSCYKWLPIIFGCHCRADRSFFYHGRQFPICARCTGVLAGLLIFLLTAWAYRPLIRIQLLLMIPMIIDGTVQKKTRYESTNIRRLITGILFGYALGGLIAAFIVSGFRNGQRLARYFGWAR